MVTYQVVYEHANGESLNLKTNNLEYYYPSPGKMISPKPKTTGTADKRNDGTVTDPNQCFRIFTCTALLKPADLITINEYMLPATVTTYNAYPRLTVQLDGSEVNLFNQIKVMIAAGTPKVAPSIDANKYWVSFVFEERPA